MAERKQQNILSYFNKTPSSNSKGARAGNNTDNLDDSENAKATVKAGDESNNSASSETPRRAPSAAGLCTSPGRAKSSPASRSVGRDSPAGPSRLKSSTTQKGAVIASSDVAHLPMPGDILWGRVEGHPWWPCLVCNHPKEATHLRRNGNTMLVHVQFFENPPSRGWVKTKFFKPFLGLDVKECQRGGIFFSADPARRQSFEAADAAYKMNKEDRLALVVAVASSDEEEGEEVGEGVSSEEEDSAEEEPMEVDEDDSAGEQRKSLVKDAKKNKEKENQTPPEADNKTRRLPKRSLASKTNGNDKKSSKRRRIIAASDDDDDKNSEAEFKPHESEEESSEDDEEEEEVSGSSDDGASDDGALSDELIDDHSLFKKKTKTFKKGSKVEPSGVIRKSGQSNTKTNLKSFAISKRDKSQADDSSHEDDCDDEVEMKSPATPKLGGLAKSKLASFSAPQVSTTPSGKHGAPASAAADDRNFIHLSYDFLQPDKIRDAQKRRLTDPDYDPRTLFLPEAFMNKQTPAHHQWWIMKGANFDTVLFFKMGKFYELFHMDAVIAVNELSLIFMKGEYAHCGFPEIAYGRYSDILIQKGYKVARVEQTETPDMNAERCKQMNRTVTKLDKVVRREICSIQTKGTKRLSFIDGDAHDNDSNFLLAICERPAGDASGGGSYGVCFVDTTISKFYVGEFEDDRHGSRLRTLISHYPPSQVLYERGSDKLSDRTRLILANNLSGAIKESLRSSTEFWDSSRTLKCLAESDYFVDAGSSEGKASEGGIGGNWPECLRQMVEEGDILMQKPAPDCDLALRSLGAVIWYLRHALLDQELLSMRNFERYHPVDMIGQRPEGGRAEEVDCEIVLSGGASCESQELRSMQPRINVRHMVLDSVTVSNLELFVNSSTGTVEGTLIERLQHCCTPFGKRLLKQWLCAPLCNVTAINDRLNAIEDLIHCGADVITAVTELMRKLPDLERLLSKIHTLGSAQRSQSHPDSRAIFFEDVIYSKRKIEDFLVTLEGFKTAITICDKFNDKNNNFKSKLLRLCIITSKNSNSSEQLSESGAGFPDLSSHLRFFDRAFDHQKAKSAGVIKPIKGVNPEYDRAMADIESLNADLIKYLESQQKLLKCKGLAYFGTGKNRFQMEVPDSASKNVPDEYEVTSQRKGYRRYQTEEIKELFTQLMNAEDRRDAAQKDTMRCIFYQFDKHYKDWERVIQCLSVLDVLISLSQYSQQGGSEMCRPEFDMLSSTPFIEILDGQHPCITRTFGGGDFIPNDTFIGTTARENDDDQQLERGGREGGVEKGTVTPRIVLVTGPNMGGKSTLMRQVGLLVVLAQLGCYVPARKCRLTPVDRVFTRLGATDRIMSGESTFFVELSETASILQHATSSSLVLLDELGRGTATYDGNAIACAVVKELSERIQCRTLFSTHYHSLVEEFSTDPNIALGHMACMVEGENDKDPSQETITFLYKFVSGACPKSYGFNAARLAQIPDEVIRVAHKKAKEFEDSVKMMKIFRELWMLSETTEGFDLDNLRLELNSVAAT